MYSLSVKQIILEALNANRLFIVSAARTEISAMELTALFTHTSVELGIPFAIRNSRRLARSGSEHLSNNPPRHQYSVHTCSALR